MRNIINRLIYIILIAAGSVTVASCENDPHDPDIELSGNISRLVPSYSAYLSCNYGTSDKHIQLEAEPRIYLDLNRWNLKIDKVDFYVDDVFYETKTVAPYKFTFESHDWYTGAHNITALLTISGKNIETLIFPCTKVLDNSTNGEKAVDLYFDFNYVTTGDQFTLAAYLNEDRSAASTKLTSINGTWDEISIGEKNSAPFELRRTVTEEAGSKHKISATATYMQGASKHEFQFGNSSYEVLGPTSVSYWYNVCSRYRNYANGEKLKGKAKLFKGKEVSFNYGFQLFLDDKLIAESRTFPFEHEYLLTNMDAGEHTLKKEWTKYDEKWNKISLMYTTETITITQ